MPLGATTCARHGPAPGGAGVDLERRVVVDVTSIIEHTAVPVVGVLVDAQIGVHHDAVTDVTTQVLEGELDDALRIERTAPGGVLDGRNTEQDDSAHAELGQTDDLFAEAAGALHDVRERQHDRLRLADALAHEQRSDEVGRPHGRFGDQPRSAGERRSRRGRAVGNDGAMDPQAATITTTSLERRRQDAYERQGQVTAPPRRLSGRNDAQRRR